jgi:hypothetical protein
MTQAKSFDLMVATLIGMSESRRDRITPQGDMTEFTETVLLKGYKIDKGRQFFAKNLDPAEFR